MEKIEVIALIQETIRDDPKAAAIINYLSYLIPRYLNIFHDTSYNTTEYNESVNKEKYEQILDQFLSSLKEIKFTKLSQLEKILKNPVSLSNDAIYNELVEVFKVNKLKLKNLDSSSTRDVNKVISIFTSPELTDTNWKTISDLSRVITDIPVKKCLKSINGFGAEASKNALENARNNRRSLAKDYFGTHKPTPEQKAQLKETDPDKYKEYNKKVLEFKKRAKIALEDAWEEKGFEHIENVSKVHGLLKDLNIPDPIDKGYIGKVGLAPTPTTLFTYYTKYGKELENVPGHGITMNPAYTEADNTFYCMGYPQQSASNIEYRFYTKDYRRRSLQTKHGKANKLANELNIEDLRARYFKDLEPIIKDHKLTNIDIAALVTAVIDDTAGRIGNSNSEKTGVFGIHNLMGKHLTFNSKGYAVLSYNGKKNVHQKHIITNPTLIEALKYLKSIRKNNQFIFSREGERPVSAGFVNQYLTNIGFPDTAHGFRKYHANRIFNEVVNANPQKTEKKPLEVFNDAVNKVAQKLGHEPSNSIKSYIDSNIINNYFKKYNAKPPKPVQRVLDLMYPNQSDE